MKRTFGEKSKVRDHDWSYLSTLRTLRKPHEPMARLVDLLEYLNEPGMEQTWVVLDIKVRKEGDLTRRGGDPGCGEARKIPRRFAPRVQTDRSWFSEWWLTLSV